MSELRRRASDELFNKCLELIESEDEKERTIAVDILSQLNSPSELRPFAEQVVSIFLALLKTEKAPLVIMSILYGIGHNTECLTKEADIIFVSSFVNDENECVREGLVKALLGVDNPVAINALIILSGDKYSHIRDWATFGLGSLLETDNETIREALYARIKDKHQETRLEALVGLAERKDNRVKVIIEKELLNENYSTLVLDAIMALNDKSFLPILEEDLRNIANDSKIDSIWLEKLKDCIESLKHEDLK